jgi:outer membrane protein OmpA-like peptidoglycan-associated protein
MTGTDGLTGRTYQFTTMQDYSRSNAFWEGNQGTLQESVDVTTDAGTYVYFTAESNFSLSGVTGLTNRAGVAKLTSEGNIGTWGGNVTGPTGPYGAVFGPQVWSAPFSAISGQSVSFEWAAAGGYDDYEIYAFLVKISSNSGTACTSDSGVNSYGLTAPTTPTTSHSLIAYGRGTTSDWTTAAGTIASTGCYRFRFVGGTFDQTGGQALGAALYVDNTVILGATQTITFPQPSDTVRSGSDITISSNASTNATGATLTYSSSTTAKCTVNSSGVITLKATGTCTITVNSDEYGEFVAAEPVTRSFTILSGLVAPTGQGTGYISGAGQTCSTLSAVIGTWNDGGSAITSTTYQWSSASTASGTYSNISGATSSSYTTTTSDLNKYIKVLFTRTNTTGSGTELSAPLLIATAGTCDTTPVRIIPASLVTFAQNGADNSSLPQSEVLGDSKALWKNPMSRAGYTFNGWNTKADGTGTAYADGAIFKFDSPTIILYAQWKLIQSKTTITWTTPAAIQEGTPLSGTQLNAVASVPGTYTYSPAAPTVLTPGKYVLKVTFVPTDAKYETVEATVEFEVLSKAKLTWANPASIVEGTALGGTQLNATASVPGTFTYEPKDGSVLPVGKNTLKVTFTPTDSRLTPVTAEVAIEVTAKPVVIPAPPVLPTYSVTGASVSTITWGTGKDAATYTVLVDGQSACAVSALTCDLTQLLGPKNVVTITSVATSGKTSAAVVAAYVAPATSQVLTVINFDTAKSVVKASESTKLRAFAATVKAAGYTSLTVYGHTDSVAGVDNQKLSVARANATIAVLKKLLPGVSFVVSGFAASEPVADNATAEGKAANRRAEIFIP